MTATDIIKEVLVDSPINDNIYDKGFKGPR